MNAVLCSHNALLDERKFLVLEDFVKTHDAIYNAQSSAFKRMELASAISSLAVLTYRTEEFPDQLVSGRGNLHHANWLNFDRGDYRYLNDEEIESRLNSSRVGLMLSAVEGANYATVEYFLCGLPLVTTPSIGGREAFYDDRFVKVVEPDRKLIAAAVSELCERKLDPQMIRTSTIERMESQRRAFRGILDGICHEAGEGGSGQEIWDENFFHKFINWKPLDDLLDQVR